MVSESKLHLFKAISSVAHSGRQLFPSSWFRPFPLFSGFCFIGILISNVVQAGALVLNSDTEEATAGYFQLSWSWDGAAEDVNYQLYERRVDQDPASGSSRIKIYQGRDMASAMSGKPDGRYEYQVMATSKTSSDAVNSNIVTVSVAHHSLFDAFLILAIGAMIFLAIVIAIFRGAQKTD